MNHNFLTNIVSNKIKGSPMLSVKVFKGAAQNISRRDYSIKACMHTGKREAKCFYLLKVLKIKSTKISGQCPIFNVHR